jgi:hypothetical protein
VTEEETIRGLMQLRLSHRRIARETGHHGVTIQPRSPGDGDRRGQRGTEHRPPMTKWPPAPTSEPATSPVISASSGSQLVKFVRCRLIVRSRKERCDPEHYLRDADAAVYRSKLKGGGAVSERYGWARYVVHQAYYSLVGRDHEWELMPLALDQQVAALVWSPLGWGRLTGKLRRGQAKPEVSRLPATSYDGPPVDDEYLYRVVDAIDDVAKETGKSVAQIALNWLAQRPTVASIIIGARNEEQLLQNLGAVDWKLTPDQVAKLNAASETTPAYPYWHQRGFDRNPSPV